MGSHKNQNERSICRIRIGYAFTTSPELSLPDLMGLCKSPRVWQRCYRTVRKLHRHFLYPAHVVLSNSAYGTRIAGYIAFQSSELIRISDIVSFVLHKHTVSCPILLRSQVLIHSLLETLAAWIVPLGIDETLAFSISGLQSCNSHSALVIRFWLPSWRPFRIFR
jgi:hypothetical protein